LGHGTHVGGVETTATFDQDTDEFAIHSPTLSSTKYWPGGIGFTASHAILMARLVINGVDHGVHAFMVQIRSMDDFAPVRGLELGDIGYGAIANLNKLDD
jgi:acyl-CoA oxidase